MTRVLAAIALVFLAFASPPTARAQEDEVPSRRVGVRWDDGVPHVSFSARDLANNDVRHKLESGLPQNISVRVYAYSDRSSTPVAVAALGCRVAYDLWEEQYRVQYVGEDRSENVASLDSVLRRCLTVRGQPIGDSSLYRSGQRLYFAALVEFNPLSPDTVQRIRRWLARPEAGGVEQDAFFGSFVSLFVNRRIGEAERTVRFRSQTVTAP